MTSGMQNIVKRAFTWTHWTSLTALFLAIFTMGSFLMETLSVDDLPVCERIDVQIHLSAVPGADDITIGRLIHSVGDTFCCFNNHVQNNDNRNNDFSYCYLVSNHHHWNNDDDGHKEEDDLDVWDDKDSTSDNREDTSNEQDVA